MDQCTHCTVRGDEKACRETPCNLHESWMVESLRSQLAEAKAEIQEQSRLNGMGSEREAKLQAQLLATQAHAARLVEAIDWAVAVHRDVTLTHEIAAGEWLNDLESALSTPINLDALHEDRARECERMAARSYSCGGPAGLFKCDFEMEAAAHRAKKEGK